MTTARMPADKELPPTHADFASGLLVEIVDALRSMPDGTRLALTVASPVDDDLGRWARFTGNAIVGTTDEPAGRRYVIRKGAAPAEAEGEPGRAIGSRLWLYTNFDCNLACDYCCVRSSPKADRRELGLANVHRIAREAAELLTADIFVTGGEPFLLEDIGAILSVCGEAARTTVLTNALLFAGRRRDVLDELPKDRVVFQISLDSPTPTLHDKHRGHGTWEKAWRGVATARAAGFRVRLAATVPDGEAERELIAFLDREGVAAEDRVVRRVALRGLAESGVALTRGDLVPEVTLTASGVYWHPVGAADDDFFVTSQIFPLREAVDAVKLAYDEERRFAHALASVFHCA